MCPFTHAYLLFIGDLAVHFREISGGSRLSISQLPMQMFIYIYIQSSDAVPSCWPTLVPSLPVFHFLFTFGFCLILFSTPLSYILKILSFIRFPQTISMLISQTSKKLIQMQNDFLNNTSFSYRLISEKIQFTILATSYSLDAFPLDFSFF